jgi:hypothetical protein
MDRCININNNKVKEIAKALNLPPALAAVKMEVWMDKNNNKIPTAQDLMPTEDIFGLEKQVSENTANNQIEELSAKYPDYTFSKQKDTRLRGFNSWSVYANKKQVKTSAGQLPLFAGDANARPNVIEVLENRGTMSNNKFKTFLGANTTDSQTALKKIAASTSALADIAKKLLRSNLNVPIEVIDVDYFTNDNMPEGIVFDKEEDFKAGGFYYSGKVYIARGASRAAISLLLHEILHSYTSNYLLNNPDSSAVKNFDRLLKHLKSPEISKLIADKYPLTNIDELLTGVFTNREFIEDLKLIPATNKNFKSIWDEILQIFKVVFGVQNVSLLDEVFAEAANIVELSMDEYISGREESELYNEITPIFSQEAPENIAFLTSEQIKESQKRVNNKRRQDALSKYNLEMGKEYSFEEIKKQFEKDNLFENPIYKQIESILINSNVKFVFNSLNEGRNVTVNGQYDLKNNTITIEPLALNLGDKKRIMLHESIHAATMFATKTKNKNLLTKSQQDAVNNLNAVLEELKKDKEFEREYGIKDINELLAELANPDFVKKLKNKTFTGNQSFFEKIISEITKLLGLNVSAYNIVEEAFKNIIFDFDNNVLKSVQQSIDFAIAQDVSNTGIQKIISNRLDELGVKAKNVNGDYVVEGYDINWKRPSSIAKAIIGKFTSGIKSDAQIERERLYQESGTILHAIQASIIKKNFPEYNQSVPEFVATPELQPFEEVVEAQLQPIIDAAKSRGSIMKTEVFLGNVKSSKAGTADLLEITPEGKYYTYDLKTRFTSDTTGVSRFNKVYEWSLQTSEYNKMLESGDPELGIVKGKVLGTYIIEFVLEPKRSNIKFSGNVQFKGTTPEKFLSNRQLKSFTIVAPTFLRTGDVKIDEMISKLLKQTEELKKFRGGTEIQKEAKNQVLLSKLQLLQDLQLKKDINKLLDAASFELSYIKELIDSGNIQEEQQFIKEQLALYSNLRSYFTEAPDDLRAKMYKVQDLALDLNDKFLQIGKEKIVEAANSTGITGFVNDIFAAVKDINWMRKMTTGISNVDNPLTATAYRTLTTSLAKAREKIQVMANQLKTANDELKEYLGKIDYSMMIDGDQLVQKFTKDFYQNKKIAEKAGDVSWFDDNVDYNETKYLEARDKQLNYQETFGKKAYANYLKLEDSTLTADEIDLRADKEVAKRMNEWDNVNKKNKTKYFTPKNKWLNPKWIEIKQGKYKGTAVEKFYDIYLANLEVANQIAPDKKFTKGFIANFSKTFIEKTAENGLLGAIKGNFSGILDSLAPGYDEAYGQKDIVTGEPVRSLYIPGTSNVKQEKSLDLAASMYKFMEGVYRYEELKDIEGVILAVKQELKSTKFLQTDNFGNLVKTGVTEGVTKENSNTYQMFEAWSDAVFYGQFKKDDTAIKIKGNGFGRLLGVKKGEEKAISVGKVVDGFIQYTSLRNLGFNIYSPITNLFGGASNQYMTGASGLYYSGKDLTKAYSLVLGGKINFPNEDSKKIRAILEWLNIDTGEFTKEKQQELSSLQINKLLNDWNAMTLMQQSENVLKEAGAIAMILSGKHGVNINDFTLVDGKLETNVNIYKKETLRQKIIRINNKNIGGINSDDLMMAKTYITGRLLMQHRSWLPALFYSRFGQRQKDYVLEQDIEGRYVTAWRLFKYYFDKSKFQQLEDFEKANMKETATEAALILATGVLSLLLKAGLDDDDKEEAYYKITEKLNSRFLAELTFFIPLNFPAQYQILLKPAAAAGTAEDLGRFAGSLYTESMGTEKEKEKNKPGRRALKLIPGANKVESFLNDLGYTE